MYTLLLLVVALSYQALSDATIDGQDVRTRSCGGPIYSGHDFGYAILIGAGAGMFFGWIALLVIFFLFIIFKPKFELPIIHLKPYDFRWWAFALAWLLFIWSVPMLVTGSYYYHWSKIYDVKVGCASMTQIAPDSPIPASARTTPVNLTIAYVGDMGANVDTLSVYSLIRNESADALVIMGDYDYCDDSSIFILQLDTILGPDFPVIPVVGNTDLHVWDDYSDVLLASSRWKNRTDALQCGGTIFIDYWCLYKGVFIAFSSAGTKCGDSYTDFLFQEREMTVLLNAAADNLTETGYEKPWITCAWHKNMHNLQVGPSPDETGYGVYDLCTEEGALIVTAHDSAYARSHGLSDISASPTIADSCTTKYGITDICEYNLFQNQSIIVVSGLGGQNLAAVDTDLGSLPQWASTYADANGALFCVYNYNGIGSLAYCYFKNIMGDVIDEFYFTQRTATPRR